MPDGHESERCDIVVVGAGGAGLFTALTAAATGARVTLVSGTPLAETASYWAQGGIAAAVSDDDSPELHLADTESAGRGAVRRSAAQVLVQEAPDRLRDLERLGVAFDADRHGRLSLGLEGGHTRRRVAHCGGSATGRRIVRQLSARVVEAPTIHVVEGTRATNLWMEDGRCVGVVLEDGRAIHARGTILSTGGAAALWSRTTNPPGSLGIGLSLAHAAGADLADLEFLQFHPTAVVGVQGREGFLITEAIRGEGATLHGADGERFIDELAPRDEVARAIFTELERTGATSVGLDMRQVDPGLFPNVVSALREAGLDPAGERIPVAPASHYMMGGVVTDLDGRSSVPGLLAVGETACTGLHGANRLASNSLSECFVFGARAAAAALDEPASTNGVVAPASEPLTRPTRATQEALWRDAGLVRTREGLERLLDDPHPLARLIAACALGREESRGAHSRADHPETVTELDGVHAVVAGDGVSRLERWQ
ncbi:MAG: FAD-dependent oxidoreductase [Solirubrobacteraceae bacterium]|nr:FAD-dependent oxidoreductase [Solirubrobacteraceae bacterium]